MSHRSEPQGRILVCAQGALLPYGTSESFNGCARWQDYGGRLATLQDGILVPSVRPTDTVLPQPPLALTLSRRHIEAILQAEMQGVLAATIFGPPHEKTRNEDFALAAVIADRSGTNHAFIAVADGVTSKTFWAERSSRLACFGALQVAIDYVHGQPAYSPGEIDGLRQQLAMALRMALQQDRQLLLNQRTLPAEWAEASFIKHSGNETLWYNTTLLVGLVGPDAGMVLWAGDGGIHLLKKFKTGRTESASPLRSTDDVTVTDVVSLSGPISFTGGRIGMDPTLERLHLTLWTDGPDRTLQRNSLPVHALGAKNSRSLAEALESLTLLPGREVDNYSSATLRWPIRSSANVPEKIIENLLYASKRDSALDRPNFAIGRTA